MRAARLLLLLLTSTWIVLLIAAPVAGLGVPAAGLVYAFGSLICHQQPERSFYLEAAQLPVCARCFGIYAGAALGAVGGAALPAMRLRPALIAAALPTAITWAGEAVGFWSPDNLTRFAAALPLGAAVAVTVNYLGCAPPRRTATSPPHIRI